MIYNVLEITILNMKNLGTLIVIFASIAAVAMLLNISSRPATYLLFTEESCEFCDKTTQAIDELRFREKVDITEIEITQDRTSLDQFLDSREKCELTEISAVVVPMLYFEGQCTLGGENILKELEKASINSLPQ